MTDPALHPDSLAPTPLTPTPLAPAPTPAPLTSAPSASATTASEAPSVAVVIATRDRPELLRRAVDSVLACRYDGDLQAVLVFDQSEPDRSLAGDRVRVITNTRQPGLAGARNSGILATDADLVAFCDDDDTWLPGKLEVQVPALLAEPGAELATTGIFVRVTKRNRSTARVLDAERITFADLQRARLMEAHPSTFLIRRAALVGDLGLVDEDLPGSYAEDYDLLLRAARRHDIVAVASPLTVVHWHPASFFFERWRTMDDALEHLLAKHPELADDAAGLSRIHGQQALAKAGTGDRSGSRRKAFSSLRHNWRQPRGYLGLAASTGVIGPDTVLRLAQIRGKGF